MPSIIALSALPAETPSRASSIVSADGGGTLMTLSAAFALIAPSDITQASAAAGQVLAWSGTAWAPATVASSYTLPTASQSILGGVKVDGTTITVSNGVISAIDGGGTVDNVARAVTSQITLGGTLATAGAYNLTLTLTGLTNLTLPTSGTLLTTTGNGASLTGISAGQVSGLAASATTNTTNASNITTGTLPPAQIPLATTAAFGAIKPDGSTVTISAGVISAAAVDTTARAVTSQITLGGTLATAGAYNLTLTLTGLTNLTLPTSGTLLTTTGNGASLTGISAGQVSGLAASATTDATNASNIGSGTLAAARLPSSANFATSLGAGATTITSNSPTALVVGPNGVTNPTLAINASASSSASGLSITSAAAGGGVAVAVTDSSGSSGYTLTVKGNANNTANITGGTSNHIFQIASINKLVVGNTAAQITMGVMLKRAAVSDAAYSLQASDFMVVFTALTATRQVTLGASTGVAAQPQFYIIKDESGSAGTYPITFSANIDGATKTIATAYGVLRIYYNGTAWFTW
jgi:hypothetical protein